MKWSLFFALALVATSCAGPEPPGDWSVERVTVDDDVSPEISLCDDIRSFALGSVVAELDATVDELARIAAVSGASDALPTLAELRRIADDVEPDGPSQVAAMQGLFAEASGAIDDATSASCEIPAFSAMYAASPFASCHFEVDIPVASYTRPPSDTCEPDRVPDLLPCWSNDGNHLAVDCVSKLIVQSNGERWITAGEPRDVTIERDEDAPPSAIVAPSAAPECAALLAIFTEGPIPTGSATDNARLIEAVDDLDAATQAWVAQYLGSSADPLNLDDFELLVDQLDRATADACGVPLVSALANISTVVDALPCWELTDSAVQGYQVAECR